MFLAEMAVLAEILFKIKDVRDLLAQERLKTIIECLEVVGEVHFRTAIEELLAMPYSTRPDKECDRAIGHALTAATALGMSLEKRPFLRWRVFAASNKKKKQTHLRISCCYLLVAGLYRCQQNMVLAAQYLVKASEAFESYAQIQRREEFRWLSLEFTYNSSTDQAPLVGVIDCPQLRALMKRFDIPGPPDEDTLNALADAMVRKERDRLFSSTKFPEVG